MADKIYPAAKARFLEIWDYTEKKWGVEQADFYIQELVKTIHGLREHRRDWKPVRDKALIGVFSFRFRHHYIFFHELPSSALGVMSILHENMNMPARLKEDVAENSED